MSSSRLFRARSSACRGPRFAGDTRRECRGTGPGGQGAAAESASPPTYTKDVLPILQRRCQNCHRRDQVGPFSLETYEQARKRASDIAAVAGDQSMPPWKPVAGVGPKLKHDPSLTAAEVAVLDAWAEAGAPKGEARHTPPDRKFAEGWALGTPDLVLEMGEDFTVPASGPDLYRCFVIPTNLQRETPSSRRSSSSRGTGGWSTTSWRSSTPAARGGCATRLDPGPGYTSYSGPGVEVEGDLGGWAAGNDPPSPPRRDRPPGAGLLRRDPPGPLPPQRQARGRPVAAGDLLLQEARQADPPLGQRDQHARSGSSPGKPDNEVKATWNVPVDVEALGVTPHMHQLGRDFRMSVTFPGGRTQDLLHIDDWDPSWQNTYYFEKPCPLAQGLDRQGHRPLRQLRASPQPAQPAEAREVGTGRLPTRCASATSASSRRARTSPGPARRTTSSSTSQFKYNCNLVLIDFFVRHGLLRADDRDFFAIVEGLHRTQPLGG